MAHRKQLYGVAIGTVLASGCGLVAGLGDYDLAPEAGVDVAAETRPDSTLDSGASEVDGYADTRAEGMDGRADAPLDTTAPADRCVPQRSCATPGVCGVIDDGCGNQPNCGACTHLVDECVDAQCTCTEIACTMFGPMPCGMPPLRCSAGNLDCGSCTGGLQCATASQYQCGPSNDACMRVGCGNYPGQCGALSDGCGNSLSCSCGTGICLDAGNNVGTCCLPQTCGDPPTSCQPRDDGCGNPLDCATACTNAGLVCHYGGACSACFPPGSACVIGNDCCSGNCAGPALGCS